MTVTIDGATGISAVQNKVVPQSKLIAVTDGSNAAAGDIGEYLEDIRVAGLPLALTTTTYVNVASLYLTAGDWEISGNASFPHVAATGTDFIVSLSTTPLTADAQWWSRHTQPSATFSQTPAYATTVSRRLNITSTTTIYLTARAVFSAGTVSVYGLIRARRVR